MIWLKKRIPPLGAGATTPFYQIQFVIAFLLFVDRNRF